MPATAVTKTISKVSYLSGRGADKKKVAGPGRPRPRGVEPDTGRRGRFQLRPTNYEGFIDADGFDGGDGQVGAVGDGKNHMEEFDMSAEDSKGVKGGRKLNQMGGRESKLNARTRGARPPDMRMSGCRAWSRSTSTGKTISCRRQQPETAHPGGAQDRRIIRWPSSLLAR